MAESDGKLKTKSFVDSSFKLVSDTWSMATSLSAVNSALELVPTALSNNSAFIIYCIRQFCDVYLICFVACQIFPNGPCFLFLAEKVEINFYIRETSFKINFDVKSFL